MSSKFFIWRLKMDTSIFSLVIMRFLVVHDHTLRWRMKDAHRDEVTRHAWGGGPVGQAGVRTYPDIFENGEFFFFRFSLSSTRKTVLSGRNAVFQNGLLSGDFFKTPAYRFCTEGKGCYRISFVISFSCARAKTGHTLHVYANFFENGEKKYPFFSFRYVRTWRRPNFQKRLSNWWYASWYAV